MYEKIINQLRMFARVMSSFKGLLTIFSFPPGKLPGNLNEVMNMISL